MALNTIERESIEAFRAGSGTPAPGAGPDDEAAWIRFGLGVMLEAGRLVRGMRLEPLRACTEFKDDATPVTRQEHEIEAFFRDALSAFHPDAQLVGEEGGGVLPKRGISVAIDPIDGTWSLLNRASTCATSLAAYRDGSPFLGVVTNPATGEIGYAAPGRATRLVQLDLFGENDRAVDLPLERVSPGAVLVNVHASRRAGPLVNSLLSAWSEQRLHLVRMESGSPAAALLEAAKGTFVYVNPWSRRPAEPFDLAAAVLLVRGAGGEVIDAQGDPIDMVAHAGLFAAGVDAAALGTVRDVIRTVPAVGPEPGGPNMRE
ncbi:MAG: inositol monophosphatase family protein [Planctomycetota bacterium]|jgi:fructose-1,6-bisphosphatase/inositol monophosphatase family enzyme